MVLTKEAADRRVALVVAFCAFLQDDLASTRSFFEYHGLDIISIIQQTSSRGTSNINLILRQLESLSSTFARETLWRLRERSISPSSGSESEAALLLLTPAILEGMLPYVRAS